MKTKSMLLSMAGLVLVVSLCIADSNNNNKPAKPTDELAALRAELQQVSARTSALENQVRALEESNANLQRDLQTFQQPKLVPLQAR